MSVSTKRVIDKTDPPCAVVVMSCDRYSDLWPPFFSLFWKMWPDCPFPVYLASNEETWDDERLQIRNVGNLGNWSSEALAQLQGVEATYVLLTLDDFFLRRPVDSATIQSCLAKAQCLDAHMLRLVPRPGPDADVLGFPMLGAIRLGAPYRVSLQAALWKRESLLSLIRAGESIWEFEVNGSRRSDRYGGGFYAMWRDVFPYGHHVVERGKWFRSEAARFGRMLIGCDFTRREVMGRREMLRWYVRQSLGVAITSFPLTLRLRLVRLIRGRR